MKTVFSRALPYKWPIIIAFSLMLIELSVELIQPLFIAKIIDDGIVARDMNVIIVWGAGMMGLALTAFFSGTINSYFAAHAAQSFAFDLRKALFTQVQNFSMATFLRFPTAGLITRLTSDVTMVQNVLFMSLRIMMRAPLLVIGSLVMAFIVNVKLALYLVIGAPILLVFLVYMSRKGVRYFARIQRRLDGVNGIIQENLQAVRLIKAYLRGMYEASRFSKVADMLRSDTVRAMRLMELILPVLLLIMNGSLMAVLWFGAIEVQNEGAKVGELVAVVNYAMRMTGAFSMFAFIISAFSRAKASAERMEEVLLANEDLEEYDTEGRAPRKLKGDLRFDNVSFHYPGKDDPILNSVSFHVKPGEKLAIMGATGSGKSTLLNLIPRIYEATGGEVYVDGKEVHDWPLKDLRDTIGLVPQQSILFTGSISDNLSWGDSDASTVELENAAKKAQIHESIDLFPNKYETRVGQKGVNLSGGQKQRLSIARALVREPSILILDDSTSALDVKTETALWTALEKESATMLVVTQKISTAQGADKILLLDDGRVVGYGTHQDLMRQSELYRKIQQSQSEEGEVGFNDTHTS
ncbi:ABC transporter ATP-binding protein [Sporosarcina pasteurii]|uniref:Lipid A export ATP-binding/permease protein MsbA n=1 Tax=Sporosarcina pasteurii TaxID=1474 RepID=A0A380BC81_SPOPA|nr:ABC transporter ATP-binding protein [Sporosarcina pasteurii]MDS9472366.1 ABC transporter ATP-binding protein [Sporosarcina pasteurii]QBQ06344.1 ABC transporter ATP-binding protein [Sporosarcina pasteurii]SUI98921.1 Lipid A export ATP-binding/permease protein MsbA [Sporosarcina pasteurii]